MSGGICIQGQMCVMYPQLHSYLPALGQSESTSSREWLVGQKLVWRQWTQVGLTYDIRSQSGERKASRPHVIPFHQRFFERKCRRKLKGKQTKNYQGNKAQEMEDKGEKCLEKHFPLLTSLSYVQKTCEKYWTCDSRNIPKGEVCRGGAQLIIKPCGICEGSAQKLEAVFWEAESALITVLWVILLKCYCSESFSVWGRAMLLSAIISLHCYRLQHTVNVHEDKQILHIFHFKCYFFFPFH